MARRLLAGILTVTLTSSLLVFGGAVPANADVPETDHECHSSGHQALMYYEPQMFHYWFGSGGDKSNMNIRIHRSDGVLLWSWNSPDDRRSQRWYHIQPGIVVPPGGFVRFNAIFDVFLADPACSYRTTPCCSTSSGWRVLDDRGPWGVSPPYLTRGSSATRVNAQLPGISSFDFRVRTSGKPDATFFNRSSPFTISTTQYGGRTVRVTARVTGSASNPFTFPELVLSIPAPPPPPPPPCEPVPPQIICDP